ncbi:MAG: class B sortase [Faecalibacterium sp.]
MQRVKKIAPWITLLISVLVLIYAVYSFATIMLALQQSQSTFTTLAQEVAALQTEQEEATTQSEEEIIAVPVYPEIENLIGWVSIADTVVDYPIMYTPQSPEYYLHRDLEGDYSFVGVPFLEEACDMDASSYLIVYAHNMNNGTMFGSLEKYRDETYYQEHSLVICDSLTEYRTYEIAAVLYLELSQEVMDTFYAVPETEDAFANLVAQIEANALYDTGVSIEAGDQILALSTCSSRKDDERFVVIAVKIEE